MQLVDATSRCQEQSVKNAASAEAKNFCSNETWLKLHEDPHVWKAICIMEKDLPGSSMSPTTHSHILNNFSSACRRQSPRHFPRPLPLHNYLIYYHQLQSFASSLASLGFTFNDFFSSLRFYHIHVRLSPPFALGKRDINSSFPGQPQLEYGSFVSAPSIYMGKTFAFGIIMMRKKVKKV